jgi:hypothetical protein
MEINLFECYEEIMSLFRDIYFKEIVFEDIEEFKNYLINEKYDDIKFFDDYLEIINTLHKYNIQSADFLNLSNIGYKYNDSSKDLIYFDIGFGENIFLKKFDIGKFYVENENEIFDILKFKNKGLLGGNGNGEAFEINDNKVLKITQDESEVYNSYILQLEEIKHLNYIYDVYEISINNIESKWIIIQDKVDISTREIKSRYFNINRKFLDFQKTL